MSPRRSNGLLFAVAEIVASAPKPTALIDAETELSRTKQRIAELDSAKINLWPIINKVGPANWDCPEDRRVECQTRHDALVCEIAALSARCVELQRVIDHERPAYVAALTTALAERRRADAENMIAGLDQIERAFRSLNEANAVVVMNGGKPLKLFPALMLSIVRETADTIMTLSVPSSRVA